MDGIASLSAIDQKMAEMRIKNLELLKRHQEIEEDRQLAQQSSATTIITTVESTKDTTMRGSTKNRLRNTTSQENQHERSHRQPVRRKFESDRNDIQPQRTQRVDYNRLKRERTQETNNNISPELLEYTYPFHCRSENNYDADEPAHAKKLVIVNNQANRVGSGRFQRTQEQGPRRREERMHRSGAHNNGHPGGPAEFHMDVPQISMWQNGSIQPPMHLQLLPTNINGHHVGIDPLMSNGGDQLDQSAYLHNFVYPPSAQSTPFNGNGAIYFAPPPIPGGPTPSPQSTQGHFHQYQPTRTFENSNRHQFQHPSHFQSLPVYQSPPQSAQSHLSSTQMSTPSSSSDQQQQQQPVAELPPRFRRLARGDQDNKYSQPRPMSGDFERFHSSSSRFNNENRFQTRPQSFYDFSSNQQSNNNFYRSSNPNNRYPRNNNNNVLPLSAYMNTDDSSYQNESNNNNNNSYWNSSYQRRRTNPQRTYHQDKHQFPLSSYDPRQYGFNNNNYQRRNDLSNRTNSNRYNPNRSRNYTGNDIDLIEEWWEDDNTELIGTNQSAITNDSQMNLTTTTTTTVDDSGNSSLSTSMHLKESTLDDEENNVSTNDVISPPSDLSTADSNIIESLDQLQQQLKLEEDVEKQLAAESDNLENELFFLTKETTTYDTAHFLQWAKEKFREELAGRLTAQQIKQHDAVATDDDEEDDDDVEDILLKADVDLEKYRIDSISDEDIDGSINKIEKLEDDLQKKLQIEENQKQTVAVE